MWYLTPDAVVLDRYWPFFGVLETLGSYHDLTGVGVWAMDNGRYAEGGVNPRWSEAAWIRMLDFYGSEERRRCRFTVVPDVPFDATGTLDLFEVYRDVVVARGYRPALATQDGMMVDDVPWNEVAAIFVGGSDAHKLGPEGSALVAAAGARGKWVHVGRVNSIRRIQRFWMADSVDGTMLAWNSGIDRQRRLVEGVSFARAKKATRRLL